MQRHLELAAAFFAAAVMLVATPALAQDESATSEPQPPAWTTSLQGVENLFETDRGIGILLVTPVDDEHSEAVAQLLHEKLLTLGFVEVVMDDAPLGDVSDQSDDAIIAAAKKYPVDVVFVIRSFPGKDGPTAVMRVESVGERTVSFRLRPGHQTQFRTEPAPAREPDPQAAARAGAASTARDRAAFLRMSAVGAAESVRLLKAENERKLLSFEEAGAFGYLVDSEGTRLDWHDAYARLGDERLLGSYRTRRTVRMASFVGGGILAAAGVGMLFVGLGNQANCAGTDADCGRPVLIGSGALAACVGAVGLLTGSLVSRHPARPDAVRRLVEQYNESLTK